MNAFWGRIWYFWSEKENAAIDDRTWLIFKDELEFDLFTFGKLELLENSIFENLWITGELLTGLFLRMEVVDFFGSVGVIRSCVGVDGFIVVNCTGCGGGGVWNGFSDTFFGLVKGTSFLKFTSSMDGWTIRIFGGRSSTTFSPFLSASDWLVSNEDDFWLDDVSFPDSERNEPEVEAPSSGIVEHLLMTPFVPRYAVTLGGEGRLDDRFQQFAREINRDSPEHSLW